MAATHRVLMFLPALVLVTCMALPVHVSAGTPSPRAERPTYQLGDKWILEDGVYELIRIENDRYIFSAGPSQEIHLNKDLMIGKRQKGQHVMEFDPPPSLTWPLEVGKWGVTKGYWRPPGFPSYSATFTWSIEAYEDVKVPAGTFKAFRINIELAGIGFQGGRNLRVWYAPEVGQLVKAAGTSPFLVLQVVAVDRPAPSPLQIVLREPKDQARYSTQSLTLTGKATSGKGVSRVTVTLNGQEVARQGEQAAPKSEVPLDTQVALQEGKNVLLVTAIDPGGFPPCRLWNY